jgi:signal transduction histidine kinase
MPESIKQIFSSFADQISAQNVKIETEFDENIPVVLNIDVEQIFANMIKNAVQAMADGGTLSVDAKMLSPRLLEVRFSDTGSGFSDDIQDRIFEPFFTTKGFGQGVGLGLSISQEIVKKYGGSIEVKSKLNEGTIFVVRLPIDENGLTIYQAESYATSAEELSVHTYY